ncbi:hypothetical protein ACLMJK_006738 [Lecanora helva]
MHISFQALVLAALSLEGALAQPAHRHQHKHRRDLADVLGEKLDLSKRVDFNNADLYKNLDWNKICANGGCDPKKKGAQNGQNAANPAANPAANSSPAESAGASSQAPPPSTASSAPPTASSGSSSTGDSSGSGSNSGTGSSSGSSSSSGTGSGSCPYPSAVWDKSSADSSQSKIGGVGKCPGGCTSADGGQYSSFSSPTQSKIGSTVDTYQGNVGSTYGHNMYPLQSCDVSGQQYSITFHNADSSPIHVALWNKVGDDYNQAGNPGPVTGAFRNAFFKFPLGAGQSAAFAIDKNSQVAFSQACDRSGAGAFDCTWGEADFGNESNKGWSGYDRSSIPNSKGNTGLLTVCADGHDCSSAESHSFVSAAQTDAGGNLAVPAGQPMHLKVTMG